MALLAISQQALALTLTRPSVKMRINYYAPSLTDLDQGYGRMAYALLQAFKSVGVRVSPTVDTNNITLVVGVPEYGRYADFGKRLWLFTMIESNKMSTAWVDAINSTFERVLVPSPHQVQYLIDSGVKVPVHYVSLGCDLFMPHLKPRQADKDNFTFLTYSYGDNRKGAELVASAFLELYEGDVSKKLIIKARDSYHVRWLQTLSKQPQIEIVSGVITNAYWLSLLENADCFVFPSRAEGYGLPPREATLSQVPTIATRWLGLWDIDNWGYGIDVECLAPVYFDKQTNNAPDAQWAHPSMDSLKAHMKAVVEDYASALTVSTRGREYLLTHHTWVGSAMAIRHLLEAYA